MAATIHILPVSPPHIDLNLLDRLSADLAARLQMQCRVHVDEFDSGFAFDTYRGQTYSTAILAKLAEVEVTEGDIVLGVTEADLFVPVLTFVFGEAQYPGKAAVVSVARLREEFYGLPADAEKLRVRLLKEAVHEIGHTRGLGHCDDWQCVMVSSHRVERLDLKGAEFCAQCGKTLSGA
ncbi:MAG: archaemetzincin family Zn-dependent metalloprotease [Bryobacteraceae bacterium]|nr:archaemetzincin family Zn-dependent metalloprotease [Bryobacteraceae bacterium]